MRVWMWGLIFVAVLVSAIGRVGAQDVVPTVSTPQVMTQSLRDVVIKHNICPTDLVEANRSAFSPDLARHIENMTPRNVMYTELPIDLIIPPHEPCYTIAYSSLETLAMVEKEYNVCIEDFYENSLTVKASHKQEVVPWYLWRKAPPCVNEAGQRLQYVYANERRWEPTGYSDHPFVVAPYDISELGICLKDLITSNPHILFESYRFKFALPYLEGMRLFVPHNSQKCLTFLQQDGETLYSISQKTNVCVEVIADVSYYKYPYLFKPMYYVPIDQPPCYDAEGRRLGINIREIYTAQPAESFLDIALKYDVCLNDLLIANPIAIDLYSYGYGQPLSREFFIPDVPPCDDPTFYRVPINQTIYDIFYITNVCMNRLEEANPHIKNWGPFVPAGTVLTIPQRPHCYHFPTRVLQAHMCYPIPITAETDLTGREPPLSWSYNTDLPYCYQLADGMTVWYENKPYTMYTEYGSVLATLQCFNVDDVYVIQMKLGRVYLWSEYGKRFFGNWLMIPQPHADCPLLHMDRDMRKKRMEPYMQRGSLYNGIYRVGTDDTLSSIGRQFGYLPEWIAQANDLSEPYTIYDWQELKMPPYPSLYTLIPVGGAGVVIVLASSAIYGLRSLRRRRTKGKKKNEAA